MMVWDQEVASSNLAIPTHQPEPFDIFEGLFYFVFLVRMPEVVPPMAGPSRHIKLGPFDQY